MKRPVARVVWRLVAFGSIWLAGTAAAGDVGGASKPTDEFLLGADVSSLDRLDVRGATFDAGTERRTALGVLKSRGFDTLRLSVLVEPETGFRGLSRSATMGGRIKGAGFRVFLDLQLSDRPAGVGVQEKPHRWKQTPATALADSVHAYTLRATKAFVVAGAPPDFIQIGREVGRGILFEEGRVGPDSSAAAWDRFAKLLSAGLAGAREAAPKARTVLHLEGGNAAWSASVVDSLLARGVKFDLVGVSWYPWYHGTLSQLGEMLQVLAEHSGKGVLVLETAYPWTLRDTDEVFNEVSQPVQLHPGYEATPEGQRRWVADVIALVKELPPGRGVFYEEPTEITAKGVGSSWDNLALFDTSAKGLPALDAFREAAGK